MTRQNRILVAGAALVVTLSAVGTVAACGWSRLGLDFWNARSLRQQVQANLRRQAQLDDDIAVTMANNRVRELILRDLIAGRLSVRDAALQFGELAESQPALRGVLAEQLRQAYPNGTDDERLCRHVIDQAVRLCEGDPARARVVAERLETDLRRSSQTAAVNGPDDSADSAETRAGGA